MKHVFLVLFLVVSLFQFLHAQNDDEVINIETSLVLVPVTVTDGEGRFIPNLKREDFRLFEDGKQQEIAHFDTVDAPFTVVLMLDLSDSTKFKLEEIQAAAIAFVEQLRPADKVALVTFDKEVFQALEATSNRQQIKAAIRRSTTGGGTSLYAAVDLVTGKYLAGARGRKAIVLFTDGIDTTSYREYTSASTLRSAQKTDAMIFPVQYDTTAASAGKPPDPNAKKMGMPQKTMVTARGEFLNVAYKKGTQYLSLLAGNSGGKFQFADSVGDLTEAFARIARQLKEQYSLGFYPAAAAADGKERDIKVQVSDNLKAKLRYRRGYITAR